MIYRKAGSQAKLVKGTENTDQVTKASKSGKKIQSRAFIVVPAKNVLGNKELLITI